MPAPASPIDLHLHSAASDGTLSPQEIVAEALRLGMQAIALTDHDTVQGVGPALEAAAGSGLVVVPAVEINTDYGGREVHLLGYFIDHRGQALAEALRALREGRRARNRAILQRLAELGRPVDEARVEQIARGESVGRPHIAAALVEAGHAASGQEAFERWLGRGKRAFVPRPSFTPQQAIALLRSSGGIAVLAHPCKGGAEKLIRELSGAGLQGLEAFHTDHTPGAAARYVRLARDLGLLVTGGSDSHGPTADRPIEIGSVPVPPEVWEQMVRAREQ
jgi:predicted metal-dependent phosphoesterase TrpH